MIKSIPVRDLFERIPTLTRVEFGKGIRFEDENFCFKAHPLIGREKLGVSKKRRQVSYLLYV
jgi:hypothetical protein